MMANVIDLVGDAFVQRSFSLAPLLVMMWCVPAAGSAIIRHMRYPVVPLTMDQPRQRVSGNSCHKQREQWVLCHPLGHDPLAITKALLCLWIPVSCLADVVLASIVQFAGCTCRTLCNIMQGLSDLIQNMLGGILLRVVLVICRYGTS